MVYNFWFKNHTIKENKKKERKDDAIILIISGLLPKPQHSQT